MPRAKGTGLLLAALAATGAGVAQPLALHFVDDRGLEIGETLDVCFRVELRTDCRDTRPGEEVRPPATFYSVRIEGAEHGPIDLSRDALHGQADGSLGVRVPRKAFLRIEGKARDQPLTLSLYRPQDPTFRDPAFRTLVKPGAAAVRVPAGEFIASLAQARNAPDLQRLSMRPAEQERLSYHPRPGWSLVVRCRAAATFKPVPGTATQVTEAVGYGQPERSIAKSISGPDGLVLLSGLGAAMVNVEARHADFIPAAARGLAASPGTFAFRDVDLGRGGRIVVHVTEHGRPLARATCQTFALAPDAPDPRQPYRLLWEGEVDPQGVCRSTRLAQGSYKLRVRIAGSTAQVNRWVTVPEAQDAEVDLALVPTRVSGEVRRGGKPAAGYSVEAMLIDIDQPKGARGDVADEALTDEAGRYELTLWTPGWYGLQLRSPNKVPAAGHKDLTTQGDEEKTVDFDLGASSFHGTVVDEAGRPVEKAWVALRWVGLLVASTDAEGKFAIDVQGEGTGTLFANKQGYRESEPAEVRVKDDTPIPPVTLVLKRKDTARGKILSATGSPVQNAWIGSGGASPERGPFLFSAARSETDGRFEVEVPPGPPRLFVSGPACPLSWFDLPAANPFGAESGDRGAAPELRCPQLPASLELTLLDETGKPLPHAGVILRRGATIVPASVLASHLQLLGLPAETDGTGYLVLAGLAPGDYELFLSTLSSESTIAGNRQQGYLTSVSLAPLETTALQLTIPGQPH